MPAVRQEPKSIFTSTTSSGSLPVRDIPEAVQRASDPTAATEVPAAVASAVRTPGRGSGQGSLLDAAHSQSSTERTTNVDTGQGNKLEGRGQTSAIPKSQSLRGPQSDSHTQVQQPADFQRLAHSKRRHRDSEESITKAQLPNKRIGRIRPRHTLDPSTFPKGSVAPNPNDPASPLFFSHTARQRPLLNSAFSGSEASVSMLSKSRDDSGGITTLKLARGSITNASPPRSTASGSWARTSSSKGGSTPATDVGYVADTGASALQVLGSVGVVDLLEQDERPTFIVDLANTQNYSPGLLHLLYSNASLRAHEFMLDMVIGRTFDLDSPGIAINSTFPEFKAWLLSFVKNFESLDVCLPSFIFGGLTWTCSVLRKRLRVISGSTGNRIRLSHSTSTSASGGGGGFSMPSAIMTKNAFHMSPFLDPTTKGSPARKSPLREMSEAPDYFGDALTQSNLSAATCTSPIITESPIDVMSTTSPTLHDTMYSIASIHRGSISTASFDWTKLPLSAALPKHIQFARSIDWAATSLGPIEDWNYDLRAMANMIMASPHPAAMYWGDDYIAIYNEAYVPLAGQKHPRLMGQSYKVAWAEIWADIEPVFDSAKQSGQATMKDDDCLFIMRHGFLEESWFGWSIVPLVGEDGSVVGLYNPAFEKTRRKLAERRMLTLREIGERSAAAREVQGFWGEVLKGLEFNEPDAPFVYLYSVSDDVDSDVSSMHSGSLLSTPNCVLEGTLGVPIDHPSILSPLDLRTSDQSWAPFLKQAMRESKPLVITTEDGALADLIAGLEYRGWGDTCRAAVVCPIHPTTGDSILGFMVMGVNPRRPYDDDYNLYVQLLSRQLATSIASVVLFEEEIRRGQRAARLAAQDRIELSKQLDMRTQEVVESETKFTRMAEFAPVGMFITDHHGRIIFSNDSWFEITRHPRDINSTDDWMRSINDEDRPKVEEIWRLVVIEKEPVTHEFRMKAPWEDRGAKGDTWVLMNAYPEKDEHGELKSVFGCLTNISQQKFAEDIQKGRMEEAIELKRQQENFIDITSHEMRNPLSAILQCADEITSTLSNHKRQLSGTPGIGIELVLDSSIDAAQTITLCAQHQKRIVDDILTLSKLDSALLLVTPVDVQPITVVQRALKMFQAELDTNDITLEFKVEDSYYDLAVDWVKADPSRLLQVLINLTTNAIKFTHSQSKRTIVVAIGASKERPTNTLVPGKKLCFASGNSSVSFFPSRSRFKDQTDKEDWGTGEEIFIHFAVQDTGRGLDVDERNVLFRRFSQASPRTHVQYGGSGLGLFVSRELTELQGGEIGVSSEKGVGSTFAFYVKSRRVEGPIEALESPAARAPDKDINDVKPVVFDMPKTVKVAETLQRPTPSPRTVPLLTSSLKVLIVEDNLVNQKVLQKQLKNLGCTVYVANHGVECLSILQTSRFWKGKEMDGVEISVVLMDLEMPVMDGLTCAKRIRELEEEGEIVGGRVPIIAVTANARAEQKSGAVEAGMDDVVSKPFRIPELIPKIHELLERRSVK